MFRCVLIVSLILFIRGGVPCFAREDPFEPLENRTEEKARGIILPSVEIHDLPIREAIRVLGEESKKYDPKHVGFKVSLAEMTLWPRKPRIDKEVDRDLLAHHVTISLKDVTLRDALARTGHAAGCVLIPTLDGFLLMRQPLSVEVLYTHTIRLPEEIFGKKAVPRRFGINPADVQKLRSDPKGFFADNGAHFAGGGGCSFDAENLTITLTATDNELQNMHDILAIVFKTRPAIPIQ